MSDKPSEEKERPRSSIFGSRSDDKGERKPEDRPSSPTGKPFSGGSLGKPTVGSNFGRSVPMPPKPATSTGSTPKPPEAKPAGSPFATRTSEVPKADEPAAKPAESAEAKPADAPKPADKPEAKKGGLFSPSTRKPATPAESAEAKPADAPQPKANKGNLFDRFKPKPKPADAPKPDEKSDAKPAQAKPQIKFPSLSGLLGRGKKEDQPAPPVDAPKIGTGKPADKPAQAQRGGFLGLGVRKPAAPSEEPPKAPSATGAAPKPSTTAAKPASEKPADKPEAKKPAEGAKKGIFARLFSGRAPKAEKSDAPAPLKTPAPPPDPKGASSIPGAPPARGEKQAKPLEGQTHVTVKNVGLSLDQKLDIVGWLLIITGVVMVFGLIQPDEGTFTKAIVDIFGALFGYGRYLIPIPCLAVGGWLLVRYFKENPFLAFDGLQMTGGVLLFLSLVTWLHTIELIDKVVYDWDELIAVSTRAVDLMQGGGWVGDRLYMILIRLTGEFGVPVVLSITTLIGTLWLFELSLAEVSLYLKSSFQVFAARMRRIRESWRLWRHSVAERRAARQAQRAQARAQREAAKLAAQAQKQPQPAPSLPAAATLAHTSELPSQPLAVPVAAESPPVRRKADFRKTTVAPTAPASPPPLSSDESPPPAPTIAKPSPLGAFGNAWSKPKSEAAPAPAEPAPVAEAAPERTKTGVFGKPKSEPAEPAESEPAPQAEAKAESAPAPEPPKPPERKTGVFGGVFGGKPKSEPAKLAESAPTVQAESAPEPQAEAQPSAETTAPAVGTQSVDAESDELAITQPARVTSLFKTPRPAPKPKAAEPEPEAAEEPAEDAPSAKAPPPPAKPSSSIFGTRASSPFGGPSAFRPAPKPSAAPPPPDPDAEADDLEAEEDETPETLEPPRATASEPRIFGIGAPANGGETPTEDLPPMQLPADETAWQMPDYRQLLRPGSAQTITYEMLMERRRIIEETLEAFGAPGRVVEINVGPTITQFGVEPGYLNARGKQTRVKVNQIARLDADLALALAARSIRIEAPVAGKGYVGIEVPNPETSLVGLRDIIASPAFNALRSRLRLALGKSIDGAAVVADLTQMPHLLIAGTTGSGKSVCVNALIACLLLQNSPDTLKFIMVDPKRVELTGYNGIPHLVSPVVVDLERVTGVLKWVTREMDDRYKKFAALGARNISDYNTQLGKTEPPMPYLVVIVDELADLMMLAPDETEKQLTRLAQMARATGIHLIISTQRPSVDVVTGLIKANFPARISFAVASSVDSRVILDQPGAEKLLGRGDMLFQAPDAAAPIRVQGVYVSDAELRQITDFWKNAQKERGTPISHVSFDHAPDRPTAKLVKPGESSPFQPRAQRPSGSSSFGTPRFAPPRPQPDPDEEKFFAALRDEPPKETKVDEALYERAVELYKQSGALLNVTTLQRRLNVDYTQAQALYKLMRERGVFKADNGDDGGES